MIENGNVAFSISLKKQLRWLLKLHGITAAELSRRSGVPKQVLSLWLAGVEPRKIAHLKRVAQVFGISIDVLCFGAGDSGSGTGSGTGQVTDSEGDAGDWIEGLFEGRIRRTRVRL